MKKYWMSWDNRSDHSCMVSDYWGSNNGFNNWWVVDNMAKRIQRHLNTQFKLAKLRHYPNSQNSKSLTLMNG